MDKVPARLSWTASILSPTPGEVLLEVGCGNGVLLSLLCATPASRIVAIDRSETAVSAAARRNASAIADGRVAVLAAELASAGLGEQRFDTIYAVNVNVFWLDPRREMAAVARLLKPAGRLLLVYDPPSAGKADDLAALLAPRLAAGGFTIVRSMTGRSEKSKLLAVEARRHPAATPCSA